MIKNIEESHFVIVDPEIWSRVVVEPINCPKNFATMAVAGRFSCVRCRKPFGTVNRRSCE